MIANIVKRNISRKIPSNFFIAKLRIILLAWWVFRQTRGITCIRLCSEKLTKVLTIY